MFINGMRRLYCSRSLRSEAGVRVGCSSTREGSGVSGCLQRRERIADAAKPREKRRRLGGLTVSSIGSGRFLSYLGAGGFFFTSRGGRTANRAKKRHKAGVEPPATGMARDYDYLFKLLIIGDSGKPTPGMRDGKWALWGFFYKERKTNAAL